MCGIAGWIDYSGLNSADEILRQMAKTMSALSPTGGSRSSTPQAARSL